VPPTTPGEFGAAPSTPAEVGPCGVENPGVGLTVPEVLGGVLPPTDEPLGLLIVPGVEGVVCTGPITPTGAGGLLNDGLLMEGVLKEGPVTEGLLNEGDPVTEGLPKNGLAVAPPAAAPAAPGGALLVAPNEGLLLVPVAGLLEV
jgi:hypothetical protein